MNTIDESEIFCEISQNKVGILLVDASGSVRSKYIDGYSIFDKMKEVIKNLPHENFRIIFWNSPNERENNKFPDGIAIFPYIVDKKTIDSVFNVFHKYIDNYCATFTYLGIEALINKCPEWLKLSPTLSTMYNDVYIITDGQMGYIGIDYYEAKEMSTRLGNSIKKLVGEYRVNLNIYTVEATAYNFNNESLNNFAGCDVYNAIQQNKLTKCVTKFVSFDQNHSETGYVHISRKNATIGFIPFQDRIFSENKTSMFVIWLKNLVKNICIDPKLGESQINDALLRIVQNLTPTLSALTLDKPVGIVDQIISNFCNIFRQTPLDFCLAKFILEDSIKHEREGQAQLLSSYQQKRREFFKLANDLLSRSTAKYIGIINYFVSFPLGDCIVTGHKSLINKKIYSFEESCVEYQNYIIPIMPLDFQTGSDINSQCLRQWCRTVISKIYKIGIMDDIIIYIVLMINLKIQLNDLPTNIKNAFKNLSMIMLSKKRLNTDTTELEKLISGSFPTPNNGMVETFYKYMIDTLTISNLNIKVRPMTMWFALVLAYGDEKLINSQLLHCSKDIANDFPNLEPLSLLDVFKPLIPPFTLVEIPINIDYKCMISLEDCRESGGYKFNEHVSDSGYVCHPINIISVESYNTLFNKSNKVHCPICYTYINGQTFSLIPPLNQNNNITTNIPDGTPNIFNSTYTYNISNKIPNINNSNNIEPVASLAGKQLSAPKQNERKIWIQMSGTIGSGKTTMAKHIKKSVKELGGYCIIVGVDKYLQKGEDITTAIESCRKALMNLENISNTLIVAIIDTCGEVKFNSKDSVFEISFINWDKIRFEPNCNRANLSGYLHWSLRNVLRRTKDSNYVVNPDTLGTNKCIDIHLSKARGVFGKKTRGIIQKNYSSSIDAIAKLNDIANTYQESIKPIEEQIEKIIKKFK